MTKYYPREITPILLAALEDMPVTVVTGMRQTGKSTLLQREPHLKKRKYLSLDEFAIFEAAQKDPQKLLSGDAPVTIDEVQKAPHLLQVIKTIVDKERRAGQFLLSGSANLSLLNSVSESLAGRAIYLPLLPMNRREILERTSSEPFLAELLKTGEMPRATDNTRITNREVLLGGMPSVCLGEVKHPLNWFKGYEQTYLERDVRALREISDLVSFRNLLHLTALRTGQILNISELGRDAKLNATTVARYLSLFETSFLIERLTPYLLNRASRIIKSPKIHMADSGLAAYFTGVDKASSFEEPLSGALLETYVYQNLSVLAVRLPHAKLHYWSVQGRFEVDFIIEAGRSTVAIEVKSGGRWTEKELAGLRYFLETTPHCQAGILAYNGKDMVSLGERLWAVPLTLLLS